jgi:hypothetical protein
MSNSNHSATVTGAERDAALHGDYVVDQGWTNYTAQEHALYRRL